MQMMRHVVPIALVGRGDDEEPEPWREWQVCRPRIDCCRSYVMLLVCRSCCTIGCWCMQQRVDGWRVDLFERRMLVERCLGWAMLRIAELIAD